jgi:hypothetical protein
LFTDFDFSSLFLLIETFDLKVFLDFLSSQVPIPNSVSDLIQFLSFSSTSKLQKQSEASFAILISHFEEFTIEDLNRLTVDFLLSSPLLEIENDDVLFNLIIKLIELDFSKKFY